MKSLVAISAAVALRVGENDHLHNGKSKQQQNMRDDSPWGFTSFCIYGLGVCKLDVAPRHEITLP